MKKLTEEEKRAIRMSLVMMGDCEYEDYLDVIKRAEKNYSYRKETLSFAKYLGCLKNAQ